MHPCRRGKSWRRAATLHAALVAAMLAACSGSDSKPIVDVNAPVSSSAPPVSLGDARVIDVRMTPVAGASTPFGNAFVFTMTLHNRGAKSITVAIDLSLTAPSAKRVTFYSAPIFVPYNKDATEEVRVFPAQWFSDLGRFTIAATANGARKNASLSFGVVKPAVTVPVFADATTKAALTTSVPAATCGQFSNGAAWGDVDGDGYPDLLVTRLGDPVQLFVNNGRGAFSEQAAARGLNITDANGAAFADYDNDGDDDLVVVRDGPDLLFRNDGTGHFTDVSSAAGIGDPNYRGMSAAWGDFDGDGYVDLYVTNYMHCLGEWNTEAQIISQVGYYPDALYHNNGNGTFTDVTSYLESASTDRGGMANGAGFTAAWFDANGDGRPDLYLANDFVGPSPDHNRLWRNDGPTANGWKFTDVSLDSGTGLYMNTMGVAIGDVDRDGQLDLALSNIGGNKLLRSRGPAEFVEDDASGIERPTQQASYKSITWGASFYDLNLDGWEDAYFAAGNFQQAPGTPVGAQPNEVYVNDRAGKFLDVSAATGADDPGSSKGVAFADYDRDGDMDMFVINQGGTPHLFENVTPRGDTHWLEVHTVGSTSNRSGCGAKVTLAVGSGTMVREVFCGSGGSGSANQRIAHFGLETDDVVRQLDIVWPSGKTQHLANVKSDQMLTIEEPRQ